MRQADLRPEEIGKIYVGTESALDEAKARNTATFSCQVGNIYTGSIYLGLASLLETEKIHAGERLCFGAYGSGCSVLVFSAMV